MGRQNENYDLFQWLPKDISRKLLKCLRPKNFSAGQVIYCQGDRGSEMFRIASGSVRMVSQTDEGKEVVYLRFVKGDFFGVSSLIDGDTRPHTAEAATQTTLEVLSQRELDELRWEHRELDDALLRLMCRMMRYSSGLVSDISLNSLEKRIAARVLHECEPVSTAKDGPMHVNISQSEIALMTKSSRQTVNKVLRKFQNHGLLETDYNSIQILDMQGLKDLI